MKMKLELPAALLAAALHNYAQSLTGKRPEDDPKLQKLQMAKRTVWLLLLVCTFLGYYLLDRLGEALALL